LDGRNSKHFLIKGSKEASSGPSVKICSGLAILIALSIVGRMDPVSNKLEFIICYTNTAKNKQQNLRLLEDPSKMDNICFKFHISLSFCRIIKSSSKTIPSAHESDLKEAINFLFRFIKHSGGRYHGLRRG
jgi:hypothetical protein